MSPLPQRGREILLASSHMLALLAITILMDTVFGGTVQSKSSYLKILEVQN